MKIDLKNYFYLLLLTSIECKMSLNYDERNSINLDLVLQNITKKYFGRNRRGVIALSTMCRQDSGENQKTSTNCQERQRKHLEKVGKFVETLNKNVFLSIYLVNINEKLLPFSEIVPKKPSSNIIMIFLHSSQSSVESLRRILKLLTDNFSWNLEVRFIVSIMELNTQIDEEEVVRQILQELWNVHVANVIVLLPDSTLSRSIGTVTEEERINLYSWFPYKSANDCGGVVQGVELMDQWLTSSGGKYQQETDLFPTKVPRNLHGCTVRLVTHNYAPYSIVQPDDNAKFGEKFDGLEVQVVRTIAEKTNFRMTYLKSPPKRWDGVIEHLGRGEAELGFGAMLPRADRFEIAEPTRAYSREQLTFFVPLPRLKAQWKSLIRTFSLEFWVLVFVSYVLSSFILWRLANSPHGKSEHREYKEIILGILNTWSVILSASVYKLPQNHFCRLFFLLWVLYCLQINTAYQSFLMVLLLNPGYEPPIRSISDLVESNLIFRGPLSAPKFLNNTGDWRYDQICKSFKVCDSLEDCCHSAAFQRDTAVFTGRDYIQFVGPGKYSYQGKLLLRPLEENIESVAVVMYLRKGHILVHRCNEIISGIVQSGLFYKWWNDLQRSVGKYANDTNDFELDENDGATEISVKHLTGAFWILLLGLVTSLLVFIAELTTFSDLPKQMLTLKKKHGISSRRNPSKRNKTEYYSQYLRDLKSERPFSNFRKRRYKLNA